MKIPDFAVSSQEAGFDEFLRVSDKEVIKGVSDFFDYYGFKNNEFWYAEEAWAEIITMPEAIALLTGKQLTEGDLIVGNRFECIEGHKIYFNKGQVYHCEHNGELESNQIAWQGITNEFFNRHFKLLPTQESVKSEQEEKCEACNGKGKINNCGLDTSLTATNNCKYCNGTGKIHPLKNPKAEARRSLISKEILDQVDDNAKELDSAHLQQQLKEAKELLEKTTSFCEDENMYPTVYHSINQFLTRNK